LLLLCSSRLPKCTLNTLVEHQENVISWISYFLINHDDSYYSGYIE
jgi:hypothetical protein